MADSVSSSLGLWYKSAKVHLRKIPLASSTQPGRFFPFRFYLKEISVPKSVLRQNEQTTYDVSVNVLLYDSKAMSFGSQISSEVKQLQQSGKIAFEMMLYFALDQLESTRHIVVEVVLHQKYNGVGFEGISLGFAALKIEVPDSSLQMLIGGSARSLLFVEDPTKLTSTMSDDAVISASIQPWSKLDAFKYLLPINTLLFSNAEIPGMLPVSNPEFPGIGIDNFNDPRHLDVTVTCRLSNLVMKMRPDVTSLESMIQNNLNIEIDQNPKGPAKLKTTERQLIVGVHNGLRYITEPAVLLLNLNADGSLTTDPTSGSELQLLLPPHGAFAIIFQLKLTFTELTTSSVFKKSSVPKVYSVVAGWTGIAPFGYDAGTLPPSSTISLNLNQDESLPNPEEVLACNFKNDAGMSHGISLSVMVSGDWSSVNRPLPMSQNLQTPIVPPIIVPPASVSQSAPAIVQQAATTNETVAAQVNQSVVNTSRSFHPMTPQSIANPEYSMQHPWPIEVRHLVDDEHKTALVGTTLVQRQPAGRNLPVTPVHIPMPPLPPLAVASLPRAAYAQLYAAGFPMIRDRHGDLPEVIDPIAQTEAHLAALDFAAEKSDPLQGNEIILQFMALSSFNHVTSMALDQPQCVFFTFQFYNFPPVQTERMLMTCGDKLVVNDAAERLSSIFILRGIDKQTGALAIQPPGCQVKFAVDSSVLKPGEEDAFWRYLVTQSLHIDIWDGDSLMLIGSCSIPIRFLLRQGKEAIQMTMEMDVFSTEYGSLTSNIIADVTRAGSARYIDVAAVLKGRLHVRLANVGYVTEMRPIVGKSAALAKLHGGSAGRLQIVESQNAHSQGGSLDKRLNFLADKTNRPIKGTTRIGQGAHILEAAGNKALMDPTGALAGVSLAGDLMGAAAAGETLDERAKKLERLRKVLSGAPEVKKEEANSLAHGAAVIAYKHMRDTREHSYKNLETFREKTKHQSIVSLLCEAITSRHEITTSFGRAEYFEFMLRNPTNEQHIVKIESQDPDLTVVTDVAEWRYFRKMLGEPTSVVEEKMFNVDANSPHIPEVFIKPREILRIPLRYQSFRGYQPSADLKNDKMQQDAGKHQEEKNLSLNFSQAPQNLSANRRTATIHFTSISGKHEQLDGSGDVRPLAVLEVSVELKPHATDQVFRFYAPENSFLRKAIRLPPYGFSTTPDQITDPRRFIVRCSDPAVIAEVRSNGPNEPQDVMLKIAVGASPAAKNVMLAIFADPYLTQPLQIWELWVHALQRYDVTCIEGETTKFSLVLRGSNSTRLVRCFTSHASEMSVEPNIPFMLVANAIHELSFSLRPLSAGQRLMIVNVVDLQLHTLLRSWLVCVSVEPPAYSGVFDLVLPCGPAGQSHNKKLAYKNPFGRIQSFFLKTNRSDLLSFRDTAMAQMQPGETRDIGLRFAPSLAAGTCQLTVYVNDEHDRNVESVCIRLSYVPPTTVPH